MDKLKYLDDERLGIIHNLGHIISPRTFFVNIYRNSMQIEVSETLPATSFILLQKFVEDTFGDSACIVVNYWRLSIHIKSKPVKFLRANLADGFTFLRLRCDGVHIKSVHQGFIGKTERGVECNFKEERLY